MEKALSEEELREIKGLIREDEIFPLEPMKKHTTMRIGGPAELFISPMSDEIEKLLQYIHEKKIPCLVVGNGSDLLVSDNGIRGVVISTKLLNSIEVDGESMTIKAFAGAPLSKTAEAARLAGLSGLEFASGIPGTIGGACFMNAGAYGGEMKQVVKSVSYFDPLKGYVEAGDSELDFGYRHSLFSEHEEYTVLKVTIQLEKGDPDEIKAKMDDLNRRRREKQPLEYASAGSTFKRPDGYYAGKLISDAGLKGYHVGDAEVSEKHAGFCINKGNASFSDMKALIDHVIYKVRENSGVTLTPEVRIIGE
jgi:UDP-N-acetylmuramate dehydrogenase